MSLFTHILYTCREIRVSDASDSREGVTAAPPAGGTGFVLTKAG